MCTRGCTRGASWSAGGENVGVTREPNRRLAAVMQEAGISNKGLAKRVRDLAHQDGYEISPDHVAVRRWLDGKGPRGRTWHYLAKALSTKLGRRVTLEEIGFGGEPEPVSNDLTNHGAEYPNDSGRSVVLLGRLTSADLHDDPSVTHAPWVSSATASTITKYLFAHPHELGESENGLTGSCPAAEAIRATAAHLMDLDFQFGGGHTREMLLFYFQSKVVPLLREHHPEPARREIFSAAAEVAQLLGWTAYDAGRHGAAQRYFVQGLRLAREANDHMLGGRLLANLSHQANYLGNFNDATQFARAAQSATIGKASATVTSMFLAMEARALASSGYGRECVQVLRRAEQAFERRSPDSDPAWISYFNAEELAGEAAHCFRDLGQPRETRLFAERAVEPASTPARTRAFIGMVMAAGALTSGELEEAVHLAVQAVDAAGPLQSLRYIRYLKDFYRSLVDGYSNHSLVSQFEERVRVHYPTVKLFG